MRRVGVGRKIVLLVLCTAWFGCKPTPEKVCDHLVEVSQSIAQKSCLTELTEAQAKDPTKFSAYAECALAAKNAASVAECKAEARRADDEKRAAALAALPPITGSDDLDKISITNADKGEVVLEKTGDQWMVTKPFGARANQEHVKELLKNTKELKAADVISDSADDAQKVQYGLDPAHAVHLVAWKGADKKMDEIFGKSGGSGEMMMLPDRPGVYAVMGYSNYLYGRDIKEWQNREILAFDEHFATNFTIKDKSGLLSFVNSDKFVSIDGTKWTGTCDGKQIDRLDEEKVKAALRAFKVHADGFGDGKAVSETGLDAPDATITINVHNAEHRDGRSSDGQYTLRIGKPATSSSRFAQKDGDPSVYTIVNHVADVAVADPSKFQQLP